MRCQFLYDEGAWNRENTVNTGQVNRVSPRHTTTIVGKHENWFMISQVPVNMAILHTLHPVAEEARDSAATTTAKKQK